MSRNKAVQLGWAGGMVMSLAAGVFIQLNQQWLGEHPKTVLSLYFLAVMLGTLMLSQFGPIKRFLESTPAGQLPESGHELRNKTGDGNKEPQIATSGLTVFGDQAIRELTQAMRDDKPAPVLVEKSQAVSKFIWRYNSERFQISNGR